MDGIFLMSMTAPLSGHRESGSGPESLLYPKSSSVSEDSRPSTEGSVPTNVLPWRANLRSGGAPLSFDIRDGESGVAGSGPASTTTR